MKHILQHLFNYKTLTKQQAKDILTGISSGQYNNEHITAFLTVYMMRSITVEELEGFREALLELCININLSAYKPIDLCGTGGDGKNTFNISTLAALVVAGAGVKVAKHGNYGVSSVSGSSNVMEYLGYQFTNNKDKLERQIDKIGICFLHAPLFHPALKNVAPIRKNLGIKTFFNMMGPLVNPAQIAFQSVGVFNLELARLYNYLFQQQAIQYSIIHSLDGYDEISLTDSVQIIRNEGGFIYSPQDLGFEKLAPEQLYGGDDIATAAKIFTDVLQNKGTKAQENVVIVNAATAIQCTQPQKSLAECQELATQSLKSGKAYQVLQKLVEMSAA
jgi:anthranilate phosphoribosyltransferase